MADEIRQPAPVSTDAAQVTDNPSVEGASLNPGLAGLTLQDIHEVRLLVSGQSVIDWHRLALHDEADVRRLLALNGLDLADPVDRAHVEEMRERAVRYIVDVLGLKLDDALATIPVERLPIIASGQGREQRQACTILKVMHIIHHLDARELLTALSIPTNELFAMVEESVVRTFDELRSAGVPVVEFSWSRKTRDSLVTKLLVKRETSAARVFDRLRFRLILERQQDVIPALHVILRRCIPFNYVVPGQTVNSLVDLADLERHISAGDDLATTGSSGTPANEEDVPPNEFSSRNYRVLNFIADLPVRIDSVLGKQNLPELEGRGHVVFVLAEFQVLDRETARLNESGDSSHRNYKLRQHHRVRERLLREPKHHRNGS